MGPSLFFPAVHNHITNSPLRCAARTRPPTQSGTALPFRPLVGPIRESRSWGGGPRSPGRGLVGRLVLWMRGLGRR
jgi:hypothetical protein